MADGWTDPTAAGTVYLDPTAPVFTAPIVLPEPDPVYRDDALFASASANWRPPPIPVVPVPILNEAGELVLITPPIEAAPVPPSAAVLRDQAVAALKAPPAHYQAPASRGGARSTYNAPPPPPPQRGSRRPPPARPSGSVTTSPATWLPSSGPSPTTPWRSQPAPPTWLPTATAAPPPAGPRGPGPVTYPAMGRGSRPTGGRRRSNKGWIPGLVILAFLVLANVVPHLGNLFHRGAPSGVDRTVNSYYNGVEAGDVTTAARSVCETLRTTWTSGQAASTSDTKRNIVDHSITSTHSDGSGNYTVRVRLKLGPKGTGSTAATLKVLKDASSDYSVCGGTNP